eukprot:6454286-Alexandrium_andersonii.AAC.1
MPRVARSPKVGSAAAHATPVSAMNSTNSTWVCGTASSPCWKANLPPTPLGSAWRRTYTTSNCAALCPPASACSSGTSAKRASI